MKPHLCEWRIYKISRHTEKILARIRIEHTRLTHNHLIMKTDQPKCAYCSSTLKVEHLLKTIATNTTTSENQRMARFTLLGARNSPRLVISISCSCPSSLKQNFLPALTKYQVWRRKFVNVISCRWITID